MSIFSKKQTDGKDLPFTYAAKDAFIEQTKAVFEKQPERKYATVCVDISRFGRYNDIYGEEAGNEFLLHMIQEVRKIATAQNGAVSSCYAGGDTFYICYYDEKFSVNRLLFNFRNAMTDRLEVRLGIVVSDGKVNPAKNCERASIAEKVAAHNGTPFAYYDEALHKKTVLENDMRKTVDNALLAGEFAPAFQPQMDIQTGKLIGVNVTSRWHKPDGTVLTPDVYGDLFEADGKITDIDMYVWRVACTYLKKWRTEGRNVPSVTLRMNFADFMYKGITKHMQTLAEQSGLTPMDIVIAVPTSAYLNNPSRIVSVTERLSAMGFALQLSRFGAGNAPLAMVNRIPFSSVTLHPNFLDRHESDAGRQFTQAVVTMFTSLGVRVIADGVDEKVQSDYIASVGCTAAQGLYSGAAMTAGEFERTYP